MSIADKLNEIIRGERAAAETYTQALSKVGTDPRADELREIQAKHMHAVRTLKPLVANEGEEPDSSSGAWGDFAKSVVGTAKLLGDTTTLRALQKGEEHGMKLYENIASEENLNPQVKKLVTTTLLPQQKANLKSIGHVIERIK